MQTTTDTPLRLHMFFTTPHNGEIYGEVMESPKFYPLTSHFMHERLSWQLMHPVKILHMEYV